tara:strand:+ start:12740 stop:13693 length:954 start_codon:yes stop_codon:yes gene_type:complete
MYMTDIQNCINCVNIDIKDFSKSQLKKIGNTPLIKIQNLTKDLKNIEIYAKAECMNLGGSVKSRPALKMIEDGEKAGLLTKKKIILDSTSGNTGISYALIGKIKGYKVLLVMPENICRERKAKMAALYNAEIIYSDPLGGSDGAIVKAQEIYEANPEKYFMPDQYNNPSNWKSHYETTGPEVYNQTGRRITHFVAGIGTSGTLMGTGRFLKELNPSIQIISIEPHESLHGLEGLKHMETSIIPNLYDESFADGKISVKTEDAYAMVRNLEHEEGLQVGNSSGAAIAGALELAKRIDQGVIVTIFPDSSDKCYVSEHL